MKSVHGIVLMPQFFGKKNADGEVECIMLHCLFLHCQNAMGVMIATSDESKRAN